MRPRAWWILMALAAGTASAQPARKPKPAPPPPAAEPAPAPPAPAPAPPPKERYLKLAAPIWSGVGIDEPVRDFLSEHFAQELARQGIQVVTAQEIAALLTMERQKQLIGCDEASTSCVAELADALGADGLIRGTIARLGPTLRVNLKVIRSQNAEVLAVASVRANDEGALAEELTHAAEDVAPEILQKTGAAKKPQATTLRVSREPPWKGSWNPPKNLISLEPIAHFLGWHGVKYERVLSRWASAHVRPIAMYLPFPDSGSIGQNSSLAMQGFALFAGGTVWLQGDAPRGIFLSAEAGFALGRSAETVSGSPPNFRTEPSFIGAALVGFGFLVFDVVPLSVSAGIDVRNRFGIIPGYDESPVYPTGHIHLGYAF